MASLTTADLTVDVTTLANYLGVTSRTIGTYRKQGMPMQSSNTYNVRACIEWLVNAKVQQALTQSSGGNEVDAKDRKLMAEAELKEIEVAESRGQLVKIDDSLRELERQITPLRSGLLNFGSRVAPYLVMVPTQLAAREIVDDNIRHLMEQLAKDIDEIQMPEEESDDQSENDSDE